jgi:hypothetical protein
MRFRLGAPYPSAPWFVLVEANPGEYPRAVMMGAGWGEK